MSEPPHLATLSVLTGPKAGTKFVVEDAVDNILIGSDPSCRFCLDSPGVSPIHARVWIDLGGATVYDTNSPRGIFVNDDRVVREAPLRSGDVLWLGTPGEDESVLIQFVAPTGAVAGAPPPADEPATMVLRSPTAGPPPTGDEQDHVPTEVVGVETEVIEPTMYEPLDEGQAKFEVDLPENATIRPDFEEDVDATVVDVSADMMFGDVPAETISLRAPVAVPDPPPAEHHEEPATIFQMAAEAEPEPSSHHEETATIFQIAPEPTADSPAPSHEEPATVFQVPPEPSPPEPPAPPPVAGQSYEDEAAEEAATIVRALPSFDADAPVVFAPPVPPARPAPPPPAAPPPAAPRPAAETRPPARAASSPSIAPLPRASPPRPHPPTVERGRPVPRPQVENRARAGGSSKAPLIIGVVVVVLALALGGAWFVMRGRGGEETPVAEAPSAAPTDVAMAPPSAEPAPPDGATAAPPDTAPAVTAAPVTSLPVAPPTAPPTPPPVKETVTVVRASPLVAARPPTGAPPLGTAKGPGTAPATLPPVVAPVEPPPAARAANLVQQAQQAAGAKNYDAAVTLYDEAIKLDPANAAAQSGRTAAMAARATARRAFVTGRTIVRAGKAGGGIAGFDSSDVSVEKAPDFQGRIEFSMDPPAYAAGAPYKLQVALVNEGKKPIKVSAMTVTTSTDGTKAAAPLTPRVKEIAPQQRAVLEEISGVWPASLTSWSAEVLVSAGKDESLRNTLNWR